MSEDDPIELGLHQTMNAVAEAMAQTFPGLCFALFVFTPDDPRANYISNAKRQDMLAVMREFIDRNQNKAN